MIVFAQNTGTVLLIISEFFGGWCLAKMLVDMATDFKVRIGWPWTPFVLIYNFVRANLHPPKYNRKSNVDTLREQYYASCEVEKATSDLRKKHDPFNEDFMLKIKNNSSMYYNWAYRPDYDETVEERAERIVWRIRDRKAEAKMNKLKSRYEKALKKKITQDLDNQSKSKF